MKKGIIVSLSIVGIVAIVLLTNSLQGVTALIRNQGLINDGYLITDTPKDADYNGHKRSYSYSFNLDEEEKNKTIWSYDVNGLGLSFDDRGLREEIYEYQSNLDFNQYYCFIKDGKRNVVFPRQLEITENLQSIIEECDLGHVNIEGYKLTKIIGEYEYLESEIVFENGKTQTIEIETSRFYPKGLTFDHDNGHRINIGVTKEDNFGCKSLYYSDIGEYIILKTDYHDWWIFQQYNSFTLISFENDSEIKYDIMIHEGMVNNFTREGVEYEGMRAIWGNDFSAYKEVLDQLGDLSNLNTKLISWSTERNNGEELQTILRVVD